MYIGMDTLVYDKRGDRTSCLAREVLVTFDVQKQAGWSYRIRAAGKPPGRSGSVARVGHVGILSVRPPRGHNPHLRCLRLAEGRSRRLPPKCRNDSLLAVKSRPLGLELHSDGRWLRLWDPVVEDYLRT